MSNLKVVRDQVVAEDIGLHLEVTQKLVSAIDDHLANQIVDAIAPDEALVAKAQELQLRVDELEAEIMVLKSAQIVEPNIEHKSE